MVILAIIAVLAFLSALLLGWVLLRTAQGFFGEYKSTFTESASANMSDMFMFMDPARLFYLNMLAIVVVPPLLWLITGDFLSAVAAIILLIVLPKLFYNMMRAKRLRAFEKQLPDGLAMLAGGLRAGASLSIALEGLVKEQPAPMSQEFELMLREQRLGLDLDAALGHMERRVPLQDFSMVVAAMRISREVGGNLAEILETLAETLRRKATMEGKIESLTAQGKMQGVVMTGLPIFLGLILMQMEPEAMGKMFTTQIGWITLTVIVVMELLGYLFIRKITSIDV